MAILKCKMCGGALNVNENETVCECEYCGTKQTVPKLDDEKKIQLFTRANRLRSDCEFDKASLIYGDIVSEFSEEAEAYWGLVLCKYGIEYVDDAKTGKKIPTCHRTCASSVMDDEDFEKAYDFADTTAKSVYREEAKQIDSLQKDILSVVAKEEPYDIFICYKETDDITGQRTEDSALAQDIYTELVKEGYKVFFSRVTLRLKAGSEYEPYIYSALTSSKVMLSIGTRFEYFDAVWVKNEWSRYLSMMKEDNSKRLIPCFKDIDAYDMPKEFKNLQALDMNSITFIKDLLGNVKNSVGKVEIVNTTINTQNANVEPLLKRAFMFLEDGEWEKADDFCEQVLNQDPENAEAYLGKLMAEYKIKKQDSLKDCKVPFDGSNNFQKACRFDSSLAEMLNSAIVFIKERNENARLEKAYQNAVAEMEKAIEEVEFKNIVEKFEAIKSYKDSSEKSQECLEKAEVCRKNDIYYKALTKMNEDDIDSYEKAIKLLQTIPEWKDAEEKISIFQKKIEDIKAKTEAERIEAEKRIREARIAAEKAAKKRKKFIAIGTPIVAIIIIFAIVLNTVIIPKQKLTKAMSLLDSGDYDSAYALLEEIGNSEAIASSKYDRAMTLIDSGDYDSAYGLLEEIGNSEAIASSKYDRAMTLIDSGDYETAYMLLNNLNYKDSKTKLLEIMPNYQKALLLKADVGSTVFFGAYEQDNNTSNGKEDIEWIVLEKKGTSVLLISKEIIESKAYNEKKVEMTWEKCTLRNWLNNDFYNSAFSESEKSQIETTNVSADKNPNYNTNPGNATKDKVFLLSITEANKYFTSDSERQCKGTEYAKSNGLHVAFIGNSWWWLRSSGCDQYCAVHVYSDGSVKSVGNHVDVSTGGVRPALWINLES